MITKEKQRRHFLVLIISAIVAACLFLLAHVLIMLDLPIFAPITDLMPSIIIVAIMLLLLIAAALFIKKNPAIPLLCVTLSVLVGFFSLIGLFFFPYDTVSKTTDFKHYKTFDVMVYDEAKKFFPDDINEIEVVTYSYYYSYTYHSAYEIYLEIKLGDEKYDEFKSAIKLKYDKLSPIINEYNTDFYEYVIEDYITAKSQIKTGLYSDFIKIAYSDKDNTIIYEYMRLKRDIKFDTIDFVYFERFNVGQYDYVNRLFK